MNRSQLRRAWSGPRRRLSAEGEQTVGQAMIFHSGRTEHQIAAKLARVRPGRQSQSIIQMHMFLRAVVRKDVLTAKESDSGDIHWSAESVWRHVKFPLAPIHAQLIQPEGIQDRIEAEHDRGIQGDQRGGPFKRQQSRDLIVILRLDRILLVVRIVKARRKPVGRRRPSRPARARCR